MSTQSQLSREQWKQIDEHLEFIYLNTDICCQDLCEGQQCKCKVEELMELLSHIRPNEL